MLYFSFLLEQNFVLQKPNNDLHLYESQNEFGCMGSIDISSELKEKILFFLFFYNNSYCFYIYLYEYLNSNYIFSLNTEEEKTLKKA